MEPAEKICPYCAETIKAAAVKCRYCGEFLDEETQRARGADPSPLLTPVYRGAAAAMSVVWPGLGHIFQGRLVLGFVYMALIIFFAIVGIFGGFIGWLLLACIYIGIVYDAYNYDPVTEEIKHADGRLTYEKILQLNQEEKAHG